MLFLFYVAFNPLTYAFQQPFCQNEETLTLSLLSNYKIGISIHQLHHSTSISQKKGLFECNFLTDLLC